MYAAKYGGGAIGGAGMATLIDGFELRTALIVQVAILLAIMVVPLLVRERSGPPVARPPIREVARGLLEAFSLRSTLVCAALLLGINLAPACSARTPRSCSRPQLGWSDTEYTQLTGGLGPMLGLGGSVLGGFIADAVGHRRLVAIASVGMAACWVAFGLGEPYWLDRTFVMTLLVLGPVLQAVLSVSLFALCMDLSWPRVGAMQFTAYMALLERLDDARLLARRRGVDAVDLPGALPGRGGGPGRRHAPRRRDRPPRDPAHTAPAGGDADPAVRDRRDRRPGRHPGRAPDPAARLVPA